MTETGCTDDGTVLGITFDKIGAASAEAVFAVIFIEAADGDTVDGAGSDFCMGTDSDGVLRLYGSTLADSNTILLFDRAAFPDGDTLFCIFRNLTVVTDGCGAFCIVTDFSGIADGDAHIRMTANGWLAKAGVADSRTQFGIRFSRYQAASLKLRVSVDLLKASVVFMVMSSTP